MADTQPFIDKKIWNLRFHICYPLGEYGWLRRSMCVNHVPGAPPKNYSNSSLATLGDTVLKCILAEELFDMGLLKGQITKLKSIIESNDVQNLISKNLRLSGYAYKDDLGDDSTIPTSSHELYLEAVLGAMYKDHGFDACSKWVTTRIYYPKVLEEAHAICLETGIYDTGDGDDCKMKVDATKAAIADYFTRRWVFRRDI